MRLSQDLVLLGARIPTDLKRKLNAYCNRNGIKMNFFVTQSIQSSLGKAQTALSHEKKLQLNRNKIIRLGKKYGAKNIRVYGSVARGESTPNSDIDLLVSMSKGHDLMDLVGFEEELQTLLQTKVEVVSDKGLSPYLKKNILEEAQTL